MTMRSLIPEAYRRFAVVAALALATAGCATGVKARVLEQPPDAQFAAAGALRNQQTLDAASALNAGRHAADRESAVRGFAEAIRLAWDRLDRLTAGGHIDTPEFVEARTLYNDALRELLRTLYTAEPPDYRMYIRDTELGAIRVTLCGETSDWAPAYFHHFIEADRIAIEGFTEHHFIEGVGVPFCGVKARSATPGTVKYPPEGLVYPVTLLAIPGPGDAISIRLVNPWNVSRVEISGASAQIAADITATYGYVLAQTKLIKLGHIGMFQYESSSWHEGLFILQPYEPNKIPLIMVHGLRSSPAAWKEVTNDVWGDAELRTHFQIWHYMYPTSTPPLTAARHLRDALRATQRALDPELDDPASHDVVLIGHSLGGLLCKAQVVESGDKLWYRRYERSIDDAGLDDDARKIAEDTFFLHPEPCVSRAIFICTPNHGAHLAGMWFSRLIARFLRPEGSAAMLESKVYAHDSDAKHKLRLPNSIKVLNPSYPVMDEFGKLPIDSHVPFHTIIGKHDKVVPYTSSHMDGAESECIVDAGHDATVSTEAVAEVIRILRLHLEEEARPRSGS